MWEPVNVAGIVGSEVLAAVLMKSSVFCLLPSLCWFLAWPVLKMEAIGSSKWSVDFQGTRWRYMPGIVCFRATS